MSGSEKMAYGRGSTYTNENAEAFMGKQWSEKGAEKDASSIKGGTCVRPNQHSLIGWLREWLNTYAKAAMRPSTFTNYEFIIERHFDSKIGRVKLKNVSGRMLQEFFIKSWLAEERTKRREGYPLRP